jgi:hypothetical protein
MSQVMSEKLCLQVPKKAARAKAPYLKVETTERRIQKLQLSVVRKVARFSLQKLIWCLYLIITKRY